MSREYIRLGQRISTNFTPRHSFDVTDGSRSIAGTDGSDTLGAEGAAVSLPGHRARVDHGYQWRSLHETAVASAQ
jgi:hypothetical protein